MEKPRRQCRDILAQVGYNRVRQLAPLECASKALHVPSFIALRSLRLCARSL